MAAPLSEQQKAQGGCLLAILLVLVGILAGYLIAACR